ncbi:hypothetical protein KC19_2G175700 [Ceratodon purpureus]|uniref:Uncharacterized protein n=1 Tax=Ceratodon purpureus TaxID=3225 RepID=A0A8T0IY13_CERPU|nr:hypothetical protein KC19_2G175700 [Ceratodon purpureus]
MSAEHSAQEFSYHTCYDTDLSLEVSARHHHLMVVCRLSVKDQSHQFLQINSEQSLLGFRSAKLV